MSSSGVPTGGSGVTSGQLADVQAEVDDVTQSESDLDARVGTLEQASTPSFAGLSDVVTPFPSPLDGNFYVLRGGQQVLCPRNVFLDNAKMTTWLATPVATLTAALLIDRHSVPAGTQNVAFPSTLFTATGGTQLPVAWSISLNGDQLPTGMTFTDNGDNTATLAGTPTVNGTFNIIVDAVDALGALDEETYILTIAAAAAPYAFALPAFSDFHVGDTWTHDLTHDGTNPAGSQSFTSYSPTPTTGCASDVTLNKITKTGLAVANNTVVCIQGLSSTTGISNDTPYYVVGSATGSIGLSLTKGGAAIDLTGSNDSSLTIQFPTLPLHHVQLSGSTLSTSSALATADIGNISFWITAFDGTTHISSRGTIKVLAAAGGPTITTTTLAPATKNSVYTPVILTLTDTDAGALPLDGVTGLWSIDPSGDALPAGMSIATAFGNGVIAGTPTVFGTFNLVLKVVDNNGLADTQSVTLTVADVSAPFAFAPASPLPAATPGTDYSHNFATDCTHPVGTLSFDSYDDAPITAVAMNNSGDTLTWSGQATSIANGRTVALGGVTGTPGVVNGPATTYYVVSSGTRTVQLSATKGGTPIAFTADEAGLTINFPTLPLQGFSLDPVTGIVAAAGASIDTSISFTVRAYDGTTRIVKTTSIAVVAAGSTLDIATLGLVTGDLSSLGPAAAIVAATANRTKLNAAAERMRILSPQGSLESTLPRGTVINCYNPGAGAMWPSGSSTTNRGLNKWHLNGAILRVLDGQPNIAEGGAMRHFFLQYATAPELDFTVDGNGANQAQVDFTRTGSAKLGFAAHNVACWNCGPIKWGHFNAASVCDFPFVSKNGRAVTGASSNGITIVGHPGTRSDGAWPAQECFDVESHRNLGGDTGWVQILTDDGSYVDTGYSVLPGKGDNNNHLLTACSGFKSHFQKGNMSNLLIQIGTKGVPGSGRRHGLGGFDAGRVSCSAGSFAAYCGHGANIEGGNQNLSQYDITEIFNLGDGSSYTSFETQNCDIGIVLNANPAQLKTVNINGYTSTNDGTMIVTQGAAPIDGYYLNMVRVNSANNVTNFAAAPAAKTHLVDCKTHACTRVDQGAAAADGTWGTY